MNRLSDEAVARGLRSETRKLVGFTLMLTGNRDEADEIYQETCLEAWRSRHRLDGDQDFAAWLRGIARNVFLRRVRRTARARRLGVPFDNADLDRLEASWIGEVVDELLEERREALEACLGELATDQRELLVRRYRDRRSFAELAHERQRSEGALKMAVHRLRSSLRDCARKRLGHEVGHEH